MVLRRFEVIVLILLATLFSSVAVSTRSSDLFLTAPRYPYRIALSFDDGPHPGFTERIIEALSNEGAVATFFVVGKQAERYPELVRALVRNGHEVANHSYSHVNLNTVSSRVVLEELNRTQDFLQSTTGCNTKLFRPPGGHYSRRVLDVATKAGYKMVLWTIFPMDHSAPPVSTLCRRIFKSTQDGDVILLHSGIETTLEALPRIVQYFRSKGFRFLTVSELLEEDIPVRKRSAWIYPTKQDSKMEDLAFNIPPVTYR